MSGLPSPSPPGRTARSIAQLRTLDLGDPADEALFRRAHDEVVVPSREHLLGDRAKPQTPDELIVSDRQNIAWRVSRGVATGPDGAPLGTWSVALPLRDNLDNAHLGVEVAPAARRRGIGSLLLDHVEQQVRAAGRHVLQTWQGLPVDPAQEDPASPFAARHGYTSTLPSLRNDLDLDPDDPNALSRALAPLDAELDGRFDPADGRRTSADGQYRLLTWWGAVPDEHLDDRAALMQRMSTDAPSGEMTIEEEHWDGDRVRNEEAVARAQGLSLVETAAVHVPTGRLVAFTTLAVPADSPDLAFQWDTLVLREHRGGRLGMAVKAANLRALGERFDRIRRITTYNAASNAPMLRVNTAMGYRPVLRTTCFEKRLETA